MKTNSMLKTVTLVFSLFCASANAQPSDAGKLLIYLNEHFHVNFITSTYDLADLMIHSDLDVRHMYRGAGLKNFENYSRPQVIAAIKSCEPLTVGCIVQVLP